MWKMRSKKSYICIDKRQLDKLNNEQLERLSNLSNIEGVVISRKTFWTSIIFGLLGIAVAVTGWLISRQENRELVQEITQLRNENHAFNQEQIHHFNQEIDQLRQNNNQYRERVEQLELNLFRNIAIDTITRQFGYERVLVEQLSNSGLVSLIYRSAFFEGADAINRLAGITPNFSAQISNVSMRHDNTDDEPILQVLVEQLVARLDSIRVSHLVDY